MTDDTPEDTEAAKVNQVTTWILEGNRDHLIREAIRETWPTADADALILEAMQSVERAAAELRGRADDWALESLRFIYAKQIEIGEYAGAVGTIKQIHALTAKHQPKAVTHTHHFGPITSSNLDDVKHRIAARIIDISRDAGGPGSPGGTTGRNLPAPAPGDDAEPPAVGTDHRPGKKPPRSRSTKRKDGAVPRSKPAAAGKKPRPPRKV